MRARAVVVGLGQALAGDDAVGLHVARRLAAEGLDVRVAADASVLLDLLEEGRPVVLVDAVLVLPGSGVTAAAPGEPSGADAPAGARAAPGTVLRLRPEALDRAPLPLSSHGLGVASALELGRALYGGAADRVEVVGIVIAPVRGGAGATAEAGMSEAVARAVEPACELVRAAAARLEAEVPSRSD